MFVGKPEEEAKEGKGREAKHDPCPYAHMGGQRDPWVSGGTGARRAYPMTLLVAVVFHSSCYTPSVAALRFGTVSVPSARAGRVAQFAMPRSHSRRAAPQYVVFDDGVSAREWFSESKFQFMKRWTSDRVETWDRRSIIGNSVTLLLRHGNTGLKGE